METITKHRATKVATATIGGLITVYLAPWSVVFMAYGVSKVPEPSAFAYLALGLGALTGVIAFWVWVFSRPSRSARRRWMLSTSLACGIFAVLALLISLTARAGWEFNILTDALLLSIFIGVGVIASLWLPTKA